MNVIFQMSEAKKKTIQPKLVTEFIGICFSDVKDGEKIRSIFRCEIDGRYFMEFIFIDFYGAIKSMFSILYMLT